MSIYGSISSKSMVEESITNEEFGRYFSEAVMDLFMEDCFEESAEIIEEGANIDITKAFDSSKKQFKEKIKAAKGYIKAKEYGKAKTALKEAKSITKDLQKTITEIDSTAGSAIFGYFAHGFLIMAETLIPCSISFVGGTVGSYGLVTNNIAALSTGALIAKLGQLGTTVQSIVILVKGIITLIDRIKAGKEDAADYLNLYKNAFLRYTRDLDKNVDKLIKEVEKKEKEDK